jgi:uncharacterized phage infection (PIP) family protein YhgE
MSNLVTLIQPTECVGNSLVTINNNFSLLEKSLDQAYTTLTMLNDSLRTLTTELKTIEDTFKQIKKNTP